jgi:hypothetical protein
MRVSFDVPIAKLGLFTDLLANEVDNLQMTQMDTISPAAGKRVRPRVMPSKETPSFLIVKDVLKQYKTGDIIDSRPSGPFGAALEKANYNKTTASSLTSELVKRGYATRGERGRIVVV